MSQTKYWNRIGGSNIISFQVFIIALGLLICLSLAFVSKSGALIYTLIMIFACAVVFISISVFYSRLYNVSIRNGKFRFKNLFRSIEVDAKEYINTAIALRLPYILKINFKNGRKMLFMLDLPDTFIGQTFSPDKPLNKISAQIQQELEEFT